MWMGWGGKLETNDIGGLLFNEEGDKLQISAVKMEWKTEMRLKIGLLEKHLRLI